LNRLGGPVEPVSDRPVRAGLSPAIFSVAQHLFDRSQVCHLPFFFSQHFFLTGPFLLQIFYFALSCHCAQKYFFSACCRSASGHFPGAQIFFLLPLCRQQRLVTSLARAVFLLHADSSVRSLPWRTVIFFFGCACRGFSTFPLCSHFPSAARAEFFLAVHAEARHLCPVRSFPCGARRFLVLLALHEDMRVENLLFGQQQGCACRFFYLFCPVTSSLLCACRFSWTFLLCPRTSRACVSGAPIFFLSSHFQQLCANLNFFFLPSVVTGSLTTLVRTS
jgi:hypothetical protein